MAERLPVARKPDFCRCVIESAGVGWRWTLYDEVGETQGWELSFPEAADQAHHVLGVHVIQREAVGATSEGERHGY